MEMEEHSAYESEESEKRKWQKLYGALTFVDDVHEGKLLKRDKVIEARKVEMEYFRKMGVYEKVHKGKAHEANYGQGWLDVSSTLTNT